MRSYASAVRGLIARLIIMLAVLVMPFGMTPAAASAHTMQGDMAMQGEMATQGDMAMHAGMPMQHCPDPAAGHSKGAMAECTMACASALPAVDLVRPEPVDLPEAPVMANVASGIDGLHPETATPPPKIA
jgi:hypothetical protein